MLTRKIKLKTRRSFQTNTHRQRMRANNHKKMLRRQRANSPLLLKTDM